MNAVPKNIWSMGRFCGYHIEAASCKYVVGESGIGPMNETQYQPRALIHSIFLRIAFWHLNKTIFLMALSIIFLKRNSTATVVTLFDD